MSRMCWCLVVSLLFFTSFTQAKPLAPDKVPDELKPWINWVLQEQPERDCPFLYNSFEQKHCSWATSLNLVLSANKGVFTSSVQVYRDDDWLVLVGDEKHWPLSVTANGKTALVMEQDGQPAIKLTKGTYEIKGEFLWDSIPDNLTLPNDTGLISLQMNGQTINAPTIKDGQLWLKESDRGQAKPENVQNRVDRQVFRKISDDVPMQVLTRLDLQVSGVQREEKLAGALLEGFIPLELKSQLPARLEADGRLTVQVRPGHWQIDVVARSPQNVEQLALPKDTPDAEIWVFDARPALRVVEIDSLSTIDASQTTLPDEWRNLPAYKINPDQSMNFKVIRRGDPEPEPNQLNLTRKLWLDFNGSGYTVNDSISGKMTSGWRLNSLLETQLGKVTLNGSSQLITKHGATNKEGVEVRNGSLLLEADSRIQGKIGRMSAVGWEQTFNQVTAELNLPPGWRLIAATGVDNVPDSWLARWTLLDLFLVLITAITVGKLWNRYWGGLALLTLMLIWHESDAPQFIWLHILAATALLSVLPQNRFFSIINWYRRGCWLILVAIVLPFMVQQVRIGIYPQLERPWQDIYQDGGYARGQVMPMALPVEPAPMTMDAEQQAEAVMDEIVEEKAGSIERKMEAPAMRKMIRPKEAEPQQQTQNNYYSLSKSDFQRVDPKAKVQTGPGLPQWQWHKVMLSWNGSVDANQQLSLWYLSPTMTMVLNFVRVLLVALLVLLMVGSALIPPSLINRLGSASKATPLLLVLLVLCVAMPNQNVYADDFPNDALLKQLHDKLQEEVTPDCLPACAHIQQMTMTINDKDIQISLQIHAQESVVLPLPADYGQWFPNQVTVDGKAAEALYRADNGLWIHLKQGEHNVVLHGVTPVLSKFTLPLPLKPKRVTVEKTGWEVFGLQENGWTDEQLQFSRVQTAEQDNKKTTLEQGALPPFVRVERTLKLGLDWRVVTEITRLSPNDSAVLLNVPLLKGESVISENIRVKDGKVEVNMAAQQTTMQWESVLEKTDKLELTAPDTAQWIEVWQADVSPIWHLDAAGIAMIHSVNLSQWLPEWHPFPKETISLIITRPEPVAGQTLTIDNSRLTVTQGERMRDVVLKASIRSSQGLQHTLTLPENATLQSVLIDGRSQPLRQEGRKLTLPINSTKQEVTLTWQEPVGINTISRVSSVDLGQDSVNSNLTLNLGQDRWVLFAFGPTFGPIILFWGVLIVIFLVSFGLGKVTLTPLKNWQWFLLLVGLSQIPLEAAGIVIAWLMLLGWRVSQSSEQTRFFNALQVGLGLLTLGALGVLFSAVAQGLLDAPDMNVTGNQSSPFALNWYQDRSASTLPAASVLSLPLIVYRLLMLAWALWLASALLNWLKWGWVCFSSNGLWRKKVVVDKKTVATEPEPPKTDKL
ncbi:MAG: hypothetical protein Q8N30_13305 [Methylococcales bacterium]|nr:hypothetical protein [Methylococcales bacterium]